MSELVAKKENVSPMVQQDNQMHPLVSAAMASGTELTPENLSKLLDVQKEWEANEARKAYSAAMVRFRATCPSIVKDAHVSYGKTEYKHETLDGILKTISSALSECGINPTFRTSSNDGIIVVTCRVTHEQGHYEETSLPSPADNSGGKNDIQGIGSTVTYLQRYTLKSILGLSAGFDDDAISEPEVELVSESQATQLDVMLDDADKEFEGFKGGFLTIWKVKDVSEIHSYNFDKASDWIKGTLDKRRAAK